MSHINSNTSRYQIEQIIRHRLHRGYYNYVEYFVKWKNFGASENSWEHEDDLEEDEEETIREYWERTKFGSKEKAFELEEEENLEARSYSIQKDSYKEILVISSDDDDDDDDIDLFKKKQKEIQVKEQLYVKEEEKERISLLFKKPVFGCPVTVIEISDDDDDDDDDKNDDDDDNNNKEDEEEEEEEKGWKVKEEEQRMELEFEDEGIIDNPKYRIYYDDWEERVNGVLDVQKHVKYNIYKCLLEWNDGKCCIYPLNTIKEKCPQKLIDYYESILVIE